MSSQSQRMISEAYTCPLTKKHVNVQIKQVAAGSTDNRSVCREPELCSNIGACGCGVVKIIYGMSYTVNWKKCSLYSTITEH